MAFHVGQKVICVKGSDYFRLAFYSAQLIAGQVYTIRGFTPLDHVYNEVGVWLEEITGSFNERYQAEYGFRLCRFRPIVERKTDISFAHEILRKAEQKVKA